MANAAAVAAVASALDRLELADHLDVGVYATYLASLCDTASTADAVESLQSTLSMFINWDADRLNAASMKIKAVFDNPTELDLHLPLAVAAETSSGSTISPEEQATTASTMQSKVDVPECGSADAAELSWISPLHQVAEQIGALSKSCDEPTVASPAATRQPELLAASGSAGAGRGSSKRATKALKGSSSITIHLGPKPFEPSTTPSASEAVRICRHYLAGSCKRSDCQFSHEVSGMACRYWSSATGCGSGAACPFLHALPGSTTDVRLLEHELEEQLRKIDNADEALKLLQVNGDLEKKVDRPVVPAPGAATGEAIDGVIDGGSHDNADAIDSRGDAMISDEDLAWMLQRAETGEDGGSGPITDDNVEADDDDVWGSALGNGPSTEPRLDMSDSDAFPALLGASQSSRSGTSSAAAAVPSSAAQPSTISLTSLGAKLALQALHSAFPVVSRSILEESYLQSQGRATLAAGLVSSQTGLQPEPGALSAQCIPAPRSSASASSSAAGSGTAGARGKYAYDRRDRGAEQIARTIASAVAQVPTGAALSVLYEDKRRAAEALARHRNSAFDRATRAYLSGNGAEAARFSKVGRELDEQMRREHARAAMEIFNARNKTAAAGGGIGGGGRSSAGAAAGGTAAGGGLRVDVPSQGIRGMEVPVLDLHGLHPTEAADVAESALSSFSSRAGAASGRWVAFLTGMRHHSQVGTRGKGGSALGDVVLRRLQQEGSSRGGYEVYPQTGALIVRLPG